MTCVVAACSRAQYLAVVVFIDERPLYVSTSPLPSGPRALETVSKRIERILSDFDASMLIVEPGTLCDHAARTANCPVERLSLVEAKRTLLGHSGPATHQRLCEHVLALQPKFARFVDCVGAADEPPKVAMSARWRTNILLACGLVLATIRRAEQTTQTTA